MLCPRPEMSDLNRVPEKYLRLMMFWHAPESEEALHAEAWRRVRAAQHLREDLCSVPWYAKKAAQVKAETGDEMIYWICLQGSEVNLNRRPGESSTPAMAAPQQASA